jgi:colicin import membrane protein
LFYNFLDIFLNYSYSYTTMDESISTQLTVVVEQQGLALESAQNIKLAFAPFFDQAEEWRKKVELINVTDASQTREMKMARDTRLALREIRIKANKVREQLKEDSNRRGKAIQGVYNVLEFLISPMEKKLEDQEKFVQKQEEERKAKLKIHREELLLPYQIDVSFYQLGEMTDDSFNQLLENIKLAHEAKAELTRKAEDERIAKEKADLEERARVQAEVERLRKEAAEKETALKVEREKAEATRKETEDKARKELEAVQAKARAEQKAAEILRKETEEKARKELEVAQVKAKAERDAVEAKAKAERDAAEAARKTTEEKVRKEREALEAKVRAEKEAAAKAIAEADAKLKAAKDAEAKRVADELAAKKKAAAAPDKQKLKVLADSIRKIALPTMSTPEGTAIVQEVKGQAEKFAIWVEKRSLTL